MSGDTLRLTWAEFDETVADLARQMPAGARCLYGLPRGGLPLAVALSHATGLPLALSPDRDGVVFIDEIADTGRSLRNLSMCFGARPALVWVRREDCPAPVIFARNAPHGLWIIFPWEQPEAAETERPAYAASR